MNRHETKFENVREKLLSFAYEYLKTNEKETLKISTICSSLKISRTTFYAHYQNTQELFEDLIKFIKKRNEEDIASVMKDNLPKDELIKKLFKKTISSYRQYYDFFNVLFKIIPFDSYAHWDFLYDKLLQLDLFYQIDESNRRYLLRFFAGGFLSILFKWRQDGFRKTEDEIYSLILEMVRPFHSFSN